MADEKKSSVVADYSAAFNEAEKFFQYISDLGEGGFAEATETMGEIAGIGESIMGIAGTIIDAFVGKNGWITVAVTTISGLIGLVKYLSEEFDGNEEWKKWFQEGEEAVAPSSLYSDGIQEASQVRAGIEEGHVPVTEVDDENAEAITTFVKLGIPGVKEEQWGIAVGHEIANYLEEFDLSIAAAKGRQDAYEIEFNKQIATAENKEEKLIAGLNLNQQIAQNDEQLRQDLENADLVLAQGLQEIIRGGILAYETDAAGLEKYANIIMNRGSNENDYNLALAAIDSSLANNEFAALVDSILGTGYLELTGITTAKSWKDAMALPREEQIQFLEFIYGKNDIGAGEYIYNTATSTSPEETESDIGQEAELTSTGIFSSLITQSLSSEEFGASLTTALTTAFASEDLWATLSETINGGFTTMVEGQLETFTEYGTSLGEAMTAGLAQGIDSGTARVCSSIRNMASRAVIEARKRLDINSPSRVFRQIGLSTGEGFALGIDESLLLAENAAMRMAEGVARAGAGTNAGVGRGAVVNLNVNQPSIRSDDDVRRLSEEFARYTAAMTYGL